MHKRTILDRARAWLIHKLGGITLAEMQQKTYTLLMEAHSRPLDGVRGQNRGQ